MRELQAYKIRSGYVEVGMSWKDAMTNNGYSIYQVNTSLASPSSPFPPRIYPSLFTLL